MFPSFLLYTLTTTTANHNTTKPLWVSFWVSSQNHCMLIIFTASIIINIIINITIIATTIINININITTIDILKNVLIMSIMFLHNDNFEWLVEGPTSVQDSSKNSVTGFKQFDWGLILSRYDLFNVQTDPAKSWLLCVTVLIDSQPLLLA